jgi:Carboxypeptidase regulatory-like domain
MRSISLGNLFLARIKRMKNLRLLGVLLAVLLGCSPLFGQGNTGRILGAVTDQTGANIAGATVSITDVQRGVTQKLVTDTDGAYVAINLLPGTYTVKAEYKGFKTFERKNILLEVGKDVRVDITLQTGSTTETITVTEEVPMVDTTSTTLGGTINNTSINDLPLNGRNYQNLLTLRPGTMIYPGGGPWTQSTNGLRSDTSSFIVDGLSNDESFTGISVTNASLVAGDSGTILPIDAIQEFNTQVNPKAEFGWKPGAVTSVGLKSGTNEIHGTAYAFGRSDAFDARNYFNPVGSPKQSAQLEQFGGSAGGPIIRDKLFYFGAFEGQRYSVGNAFTESVPTTVSVPGGGGTLTGGCVKLTTGDCTNSIVDATNDLVAQNPSFVVNPLSAYLLQFYGPNSNSTEPANAVPRGFPNENTSNNIIGKVDYHLSDHNALSGSYFFGNGSLLAMDAPETLPEFRTDIHSRAQAAAGHWAWTPSSTWANELRVGYTRFNLGIIPANVGIKYNINTGVTNPVLGGIPNIRISGFTEMGGFHNFPKIIGPDNVYDFIDQVSYLRGKHAFKFGGELRDDKVHQGTFRGGRGRIQFSSLESFLSGAPKNVNILLGDPTRNLTQWLFAGFLQDDWRITPRITLNLGIRYEYDGVPSDANNLLGNWEPNVGFEQVGKNISSIYKGDHTNFSPRFGIAWDITGKGTTVIRAGGSLIYDLLDMQAFLSQQDTNNTITLGLGTIPTGATIQVNGVNTPGIGNIQVSGITLPGSQLNWVDGKTQVYPASIFGGSAGLLQCGDGIGADAGPCDIFAMNRNYKTPYVSTWTIGIQHAFSNRIALDLAYVGNHGTKLPGIQDLNQAALGSGWTAADIAAGVANQDGNEQSNRPFSKQFPYLEFINYLTNLYKSNYNGLQAAVTARNYHGLDFVLGYTYSHALDNMSFNWNQFLPLNSSNPAGEYASSDFDIRHRFTLSLTYTVPGIKTWGQALEGWQINSIVTLQSGQPWQAFDSVNDISGTGDLADRWNFFGKPSDFKSQGPNALPFFPAATNAACAAKALALDGGTSGLNTTALGLFGCYVNGSSMLLPPALGTFGNLGRNVFRDTGFHNMDLSITKNWKFKERLTAQFRAEMFNVLNHPNFANPYGGISGYGIGATADPSAPGLFGCGCATPDGAAVNPLLGSGSNRAIQLGLKFIF